MNDRARYREGRWMRMARLVKNSLGTTRCHSYVPGLRANVVRLAI